MISHEHKCIFVRMPKRASTSICRVFGMDWDNPDMHYMNEGPDSDEALSAPPYFKFSVVRNPYDRFVSGWKFCEYTKDRPLLDVLRNLLRWHQVPVGFNFSDPATDFFAYTHITKPQHERLLTKDGRLGVDFIMRYESLQSDFDHVCGVLGMPKTILPHVNRTPARKLYRSYFDGCREARSILEEHFRPDFHLFDYAY